ncbi:suppressor of glycerol defect [Conoideocrella luteorostrata]|uniref:Suppressor of glycerol defect n=1 Tax=Conoideocrella luteorostrata TaxID=1105319 RepID=A0AAJ0CZD7_9HYPO|nr:suppressor of glycerol defect [Conoideocrella luteorostrata]
MPDASVPELQHKLFKRMGISSLPLKQSEAAAPRPLSGRSPYVSRKEVRRQQRTDKKSRRYSKLPNTAREKQNASLVSHAIAIKTTFACSDRALSSDPRRTNRDESLVDCSSSSDNPEGSINESESSLNHLNDGSASQSQHTPQLGSTSKALLKRLAQDDIEVEEFERKLGIRKGRRSLPQAFKDDGLDELIGEIGEDISTSDDEKGRQEIAYNDWLSSKRRKTGPAAMLPPRSDQRYTVGRDLSLENSDHSLYDNGYARHSEGVNDKFSAGQSSNHLLDDVDAEDGDCHEVRAGCSDQTYQKFGTVTETAGIEGLQPKENPYIPPTEGIALAKYVPPSKRRNDENPRKQTRSHLQKRVQGLINRLTDANLISIVHSVDEIYQSNPRGEVTETLTDAILAQMRKSETLPDQFFVLVGGFSAAIYKVTGSSFGSHMVRQVVQEFSEQYDYASVQAKSQPGIRKEPSNFLTFLTQLYVFEVLGCNIVFDYMERLLNSLSELNVELLLRVCRMAGRLLRRDDPQALKHVSHILSTAVSRIGYSNVSARTKFMVETIQNLKNSKSKGTDSIVVSEHVLRMKKRLGELKSQSRRLDGLTPMGIRLNDVEDMDKHGKWWLVGASVPEYRDAAGRAKMVSRHMAPDHSDGVDDEDMDFVLPDYPKKAKAQGLTAAAQIAIFTAIMSALDYEHGYRQFVNLKLKRDEQLEITRVLVQCVGSEVHYNEYYALVGRQACANSRVRFSFQDRLWKIFRGLGESLFGEGLEDEETSTGERMKSERRLSHVARFYASLVAEGALSISLLKPVELPEMNAWASLFMEWFLLSLIRECKGKENHQDTMIERIFGPARELPTLAAGLHWFLRKRLRKSKHIGEKEKKGLQRAREKVQIVVQCAAGAK